MAKSQLFQASDRLHHHPRRRLSGAARASTTTRRFVTAHTVLERGGIVLMYGEGGRSRTKELGEPKPGLGRLALESGVPVVPVAIHGSEHVRDFRRLSSRR